MERRKRLPYSIQRALAPERTTCSKSLQIADKAPRQINVLRVAEVLRTTAPSAIRAPNGRRRLLTLRAGSREWAAPGMAAAHSCSASLRMSFVTSLLISEELHRARVDVAGNRFADGVADRNRARVMHPAPDPGVVAIAASLRDAGVRPAGLP
jgi:hypothetical protein